MPPVSNAVARALELNDRLCRLNGYQIGGEILRMYGATLEDVELIAEIADFQRETAALNK